MMQLEKHLIKLQEQQGYGYPGGPKVDKLAKEGNPCIEFPKTHFENLDFSFSGIKTAVINLNHKNPELNKADLCASFQKTVTEELIENTKRAIKYVNNSVGVDVHIDPKQNKTKLVLAGGVSANSYIRKEFEKLQKEENIEVYFPELKLCTDNAAMIASAGYYNFLEGNLSDLTLNAIPNLKLFYNKR